MPSLIGKIIWSPIENGIYALGEFKLPTKIVNAYSILYVFLIYILVIYYKFHIFGVALARFII